MEKHSAELAAKEQRDKLRDQRKAEAREKIPIILKNVPQEIGEYNMDGIYYKIAEPGSPSFSCADSLDYDQNFITGYGEKLVKEHPWMVFCGVYETDDKLNTLTFSGKEVSKTKNAGNIAKAFSEECGGSGGGTAIFGQGGGKDKSKKEEAINKAKSMVLE